MRIGRVLPWAVAGAAVVALSLVGSILTPSWERPELPTAFPGLPAAPPVADPVLDAPITHEDVSVPVQGTTLAATVIAPTTPGRHPAVVFVSGSGTGARSGLQDQAELFAKAGIVTVVYDKRRSGYTFLHRDYAQLADDALTVAGLLHGRADVDPARVGLWGVSEGGWVVPIAATKGPDITFTVLVSAPTMSPGRQLAWSADDGLQRIGAPKLARRIVAGALGMGGTDYSDYDPVPVLERLRQPVLAVYGSADRAVPPAESARILVDSLERGGNHAYTVRFFADADHGLKVRGALAPGYLATVVGWIKGLPDLPAPTVAGAPPIQKYAASELPSGFGFPFLLSTFGLITAGYLAGPVAALLRRRRRIPDPAWPAVRRRLRLRRLTAAGAGTAVGFNVVLGALVAMAFTGGPAVVADGAWLVLRLAAVGTVVLAVFTGFAVAAERRSGWRPNEVATTALVGVSGATVLVLALAAYWGLFAPAW